ncbi:tyrosine-protein phosphatase non-receptor type 9 [Lepeophtheirus salmonis]|uniref:Tyrosine-protein phosphatase non-receptor type 9 n=1 Tax=Lepeophtheirus salmonis TaxID=72036 RepID=A0A0K2T2D7_LEPSM|nr:tyrosine-protein phosphatase non-receptor type 9-like [Lepeophtheirus salmonis]XP_040576039.1 tyrosine-protein phosphatase non-receptor type 9-like [Lepeophtheirus salmonis]
MAMRVIHTENEGDGGDRLSEEEESALTEFLSHVNAWRDSRGLDPPLARGAALKFLMARRFNVDRSLLLYQSHESMRVKEGLSCIHPEKDEELKAELESGKFTILPVGEGVGATVAVFHASKHLPSSVSQRTTLQGVIYQLDAALADASTLRGGLIFIYNMTGSSYANFDYELSSKILHLLKGSYPARLKKVLIVTAPLWFKAPFKVLRLFVREKLRDRVYTVSNPQLASHIPPDAIPFEMGGKLRYNHEEWLKKCASIEVNTFEQTPGEEPTLEQLKTLTSAKGAPLSQHSIGSEAAPIPRSREDGNPTHNGEATSSPSSGFSEEDLSGEDTTGMDLLEFIKHVRAKGRRGLYEEYEEIRSRPASGTFETAKLPINQNKNRYMDVLCFDHTRVRLVKDCDGSNYINANFVDGFRQPRAFISTQGPLTHTFTAFWQMIWEQDIRVVVMTTKTMERHRQKCGQYWPEDEHGAMVCGYFEITSIDVQDRKDFIVTELTLFNTSIETSRTIYHFQFLSWPDYGVPSSALSMLHFLQCVREQQASVVNDEASESWKTSESPILVHCSAGIGRTGTFATLDYAIRKFTATGKIDIRSIVEKIRSQRASSIQVQDQYVFCHLAFLEYALNMKYVEEIDLSGFDDLYEESE